MIVRRIDEFKIDDIKQINGEGRRLYQTPSGSRYPSITSVTGILSKKGIAEWRKNVGDAEANRVSAVASRRGTRLHLVAEKYITEQPDYQDILDSSMPDVKLMWNDMREKLKGLTEVLASETKLWSDELEVAGTVDCIGKYFGKYAIIDFKTSRKKKNKEKIIGYFLQAAAYAKMWEERTGMKIPHLVILIATEETGKTYLFHEPSEKWIPHFKKLREIYKKQYGI